MSLGHCGLMSGFGGCQTQKYLPLTGIIQRALSGSFRHSLSRQTLFGCGLLLLCLLITSHTQAQTGPETLITSGPEASTQDKTATFTFTSPDTPTASFECRLDNGVWSSCSSPAVYTDLSGGVHYFEVRAVNASGVRDSSPALRVWNIISSGLQVAASYYHTCAVNDDGELYCWGYNVFSQLGLGDTSNRNAPVRVGTDSDWASVKSEIYSTCAIKTNGTLWCWGYNVWGQLGVGDTATRNVPTQVGTDSDWSIIGAGYTNQCAIKLDGSLWCWGYGGYGGNGQGNTTQFTTPQQVPLAGPWTDIEMGAYHACGIRNNSELYCWGYNNNGAVGDGSSGNNRLSPVRIEPGIVWSQVNSLGFFSSCAVTAGTQNYCWGDNTYGQLGIGNQTAFTTPQEIPGSSFSEIEQGGYTGCAAGQDTQGYCWGLNNFGQLGDGTTSNRSSPNTIPNHTGWKAIDTNYSHSCGVKNSGELWCWGANNYGGLGDGTTTQRTTPVQIAIPNSGGGGTGGDPVDTQIDTSPSSLSNSNDATFTFSSSRPAEFTCRLDGGDWLPCSSPQMYSALPDGAHRFQVYAHTNDGEVDPSPAEFEWVIDTQAPVTTISSAPPAKTNTGDASFEFSANDSAAGFECRLHDGGSWSNWAACSNPHDYNGLADGNYRFSVRATDAAGNQEATPPEHSWEINSSALITTIHTGPPTQANDGNASFTFSANRQAGFECRLNSNGSWSARQTCSSPHNYNDLGEGNYIFEVRATDEFGNIEQNPPTWAWSWSTRFAHLFTGAHHSCAISEGGALSCWGQNDHGQLGDGTRHDKASAVTVGTSLSWTAVALGTHHSCGLRSDSSLWCWGNNAQGQLGQGSIANTVYTQPQQVPGNWLAVSAGEHHSCGLQDMGSNGEGGQTIHLYCWGANYLGQLGTGHFDQVATPAYIEVIIDNPNPLGEDEIVDDWNALDSGLFHNCATRQPDPDEDPYQLWCWGDNEEGQLGTGDTETRIEPVRVTADTDDSDWRAVALGDRHSCAIKNTQANDEDNYSLHCWGSNNHSQLGGSTNPEETQPQTVTPPVNTEWLAVSTGSESTCSVNNEGNWYCWGRNDRGQLGIGSNDNPNDGSTDWHLNPVNSGPWEQIKPARQHSCGLNDDGHTECWGQRLAGLTNEDQTADTVNSASAVQIAGSWQQSSAGGHHSCAINSDGRLFCWGLGSSGATARPQGIDSYAPVEIPLSAADENANIRWHSVTTGNAHSCALKDNGDPTGDPNPQNSAWCWGDAGSGRIGQSATGAYAQDQTTPMEITPPLDTGHTLVEWLSLSAGGQHSCGVVQSEEQNLTDPQNPIQHYRLYCWGDNAYSQLGDPAISPSGNIQRIGNGDNWASVSAGQRHTCALDRDDELYCWGDNRSGQAGQDAAISRVEQPARVGSASDWQSVSTGGEHTCGIRQGDVMQCWGAGRAGQNGQQNYRDIASPQSIAGQWLDVSAGDSHSCALAGDGSLQCWGNNQAGQGGIPGFTGSNSPVQAGTQTNWQYTSTGRDITCAINSSDELHCFGGNFYGQRGDSSAWKQQPAGQ